MFMGNEHHEKIKQIYSQTDKIIEETLSKHIYDPLCSNEYYNDAPPVPIVTQVTQEDFEGD